jgi:hypothetical protein
VQGFLPGTQPPELIARLNNGGYLWVRRNLFALNAVLFDAAMTFVSESQFPNVLVEALNVADVNGDGLPDILTGTSFPHNTAMQVYLVTGGSGVSGACHLQHSILPEPATGRSGGPE